MIGTPSALAPHGPLTVSVVSPIVGSFRRACCTKRSSRSAHSCPREPNRGSLSRFRPVSQSLHLFVSGLRDLGLLLDDQLGSAPSPLYS